MATPHFYQHTSGYIFRYCVPHDVQSILKQREFRYSLRTGSLRTARERATLLMVRLKSYIMELRAGVDHSLESIKLELMAIQSAYTTHEHPTIPIHFPSATVYQNSATSSMLFSELVKQYVEENQTWSAKTKHENEAIFELFIRVSGDLEVQKISRKLMSDYKKTMLRLPPRLSMHPSYKSMPIKKILKETHKLTSTPATVNKHLVRLSSLFKYAVLNGMMEHNPATEMQIKIKKRDDEHRAAFSDENLDKLFKSKEYVDDIHTHSFQFWIPILALYTGARLEELAQLHLEDIRKVEGVWCLDINDEGEKRIKSKSSKRLIPLHSFLVDSLGIVKHAQALRSQGHERLFPELPRRNDRYGQPVSKWFNVTYKKNCDLIPPSNGAKLDFHSFRHTFINTLKQLQVNPDLIRELDGHKTGDMTMDRYGKAFGARLLMNDAISRFDYDYEHLCQGKWSR